MKLWLLERADYGGYDSFDAAVVVAEDEESARRIHPNEDGRMTARTNDQMWPPDLALVTVKLLGEAVEGTLVGVILGSYNAG